jgi:predicted Kef-type K+ transport protein
VAAWLLSNASSRVLSGYGSRLFFFSVIGIVFTLFGIMLRFGLAKYPLADAVGLSVHDLVAWVVTGLVVARFVRPAVLERAARAG